MKSIDKIMNTQLANEYNDNFKYHINSLAYTYATLDHTDISNKDIVLNELVNLFKKYSENYRALILKESKNNIPEQFQVFSNKDIQPIKFTQLEYKSLFNEFIEGLLEIFNDSPLTNEKGLRVEKSTVEAIKYRLLDLLKSID